MLVEVGERFHQLIALRDGQIGVVERGAGFAVGIEPPVALQDRLIEECAFRTQERLHDQSIIG